MNWITDFVRPKLQALVQKTDVPEDLWDRCPKCEQMIFHRDLVRDLHVCHHCGHHMRLGAKQRLELLYDGGKYTKVALEDPVSDPLKFKDTKRYTDRLKESRKKTGEQDAILVGKGKMGDHNCVTAAIDFPFMGGSMGLAVGQGLVTAAQTAVNLKAPLITIPTSGGARMQEGILSLMQMPRSIVAIDMVKEAGLPFIVILCDPTTGGVAASFAMLGDIAIAEPDSLICFAGPRVIEETIREKLPEGFQKSEFLMDHGMIDMVVPRNKLRDTIITLLDLILTPQKKRA
ncbi:MAG: acetyl-CoA carboxylase carboxyltransferase subunit beta [Alphaproteobacteria bacterium]|jgi:acetyl-CoA carboxylase carboxyl transferase subunit beta|nr:acetyl-CoA carboxylase carboxyltransferase subunit beta [Alphaproteobacteria bacterium]MBT5390172.1 acetyl-CoA carboxylase carboxyltransferase subunit beta [Alphaproteobacteria bacterium]MBT5541090.1 acetyl-CoA carboxylase carboxyltransferase subunit beta [Alphaproteobacteria bacterium]MBT5654607.1 acetyl-CoA carboxylase carboxyltransferase subunit beta [Alphaproteobacteria bacterium]